MTTKVPDVLPIEIPQLDTAYQLPEKFSAFLRDALDDLRTCEKDPRYEVNMYRWHSPATDESGAKICMVCLAGSVIAQRCNVPPSVLSDPFRVGRGAEFTHALFALNFARQGEIVSALHLFNGWEETPTTAELSFLDFPSGLEYPNPAWWSCMESTVTLLEALGY